MEELKFCSTCNRPCGRAGTDPKVRNIYGDNPVSCGQWTNNYKEPVCPKCGGKLHINEGNCWYQEYCTVKGCDYQYELDSSD